MEVVTTRINSSTLSTTVAYLKPAQFLIVSKSIQPDFIIVFVSKNEQFLFLNIQIP